ncbi:cell division protein SepF [Lederbergia lenta]|uniref:Cell division protein SepF n=1 Tax=Lederbergia lenta TaxID=1467 RepID=A0A2X4W757_LEDLE|nr:cell division protein SepF [Lederbergia lenta]MCM3110224.1 cell division protein SepF [Lederbergia lenta]MEC2324208.1 cell division protein SepF [Lederbergia lenta]SQI60487.1 cell division machinery factor [Lederbergia lenta]
MGMKTKFKNFFQLEDEYEYEEEEVVKETRPSVESEQPINRKQNVVSLQSVQKSSKVILIEPRVYAEAQEVADHLVNRRAVVVNLQRIQRDQGVRIVDFLSGAVYAIGGDIQKVGQDIFLCTPDNVEVSGNISELMNDSEFQDTRWS